MGLRAQVLRLCVKYLTSVKANTDLVRLLMKHEHLAWTLLDETKTRLMKPEENTKRSPNAQLDEVLKKSAECDRLAAACENLTAELLAAKDQCIDLSTRNGNLAAHNSKLLDKTKPHGHKIGALYGKHGRLNAEVREIKNTIDRAEQRLQDISQCCDCGFGFGADLEFKDDFKTFLVKCARCLKSSERGETGMA
jgi:predicted Zn-ribbon and HTH transcriptional regulator